jgi:histone acetyltransferase MYST1
MAPPATNDDSDATPDIQENDLVMVDSSDQQTDSNEPSPESKQSSLHVDTTQQQQQQPLSKKARSESRNSLSDRATPTASSIDMHPYSRSSVIEVWLKEKKHASADDDWWSDPDSSEDEDATNSNQAIVEKKVLLCDVIDRAVIETPNAAPIYKYYVHYRDFNRRMDEWITVDRIVSPPSVGNAKARALKKEEERLKKLQQREEERALAELAELQGPRSRRKSSTQGKDGDGAGGRTSSRRVARRKGKDDDDDDVTVLASNQFEDDDQEEIPEEIPIIKPDVIARPSELVTTHTVGEHVVATVQAPELDEHEGLDEASLREHEEVTKVKNVNHIELGEFQMETWYFSPLPKELLGSTGLLEVLYVCEFSFNMFSRKSELRRFQARIPRDQRHPPGNEIYRKGNLAMFEVDGLEEKIYCQNLCYIAKLFLDHKTLYFDVDPFLFYVLCEIDERGFHPVGYFSKEKYSDVGFNLACILSFPSHQRKGYGRFLIAFSYELTKKEEKVGSPEKPMSDLGQQAYKPYWASTILDFLLNESDEKSLSIMDISKRTSIMAEDIVFTLNMLGILKIINGVYFIAAERSLLTKLAEKYPVKEPRVDPSRLHWTPFLTDIKRDKFSIHSKKSSVEANDPALMETK